LFKGHPVHAVRKLARKHGARQGLHGAEERVPSRAADCGLRPVGCGLCGLCVRMCVRARAPSAARARPVLTRGCPGADGQAAAARGLCAPRARGVLYDSM